MQHLIAKTGLGLAIAKVIEHLHLQADKSSINSMLIDIFSSKFEEFKTRHSQYYRSCIMVAYYIVENEYPVGENDMHQYFRCLANEVKIGNSPLSIGKQEERRHYTIIEGFSRNEDIRRRPPQRPANYKRIDQDSKESFSADKKPQKRPPSLMMQERLKKRRRESARKSK